MGRVYNVYLSDRWAVRYEKLRLAGWIKGTSALFRLAIAGAEESYVRAERKRDLRCCVQCGAIYSPVLKHCPNCHAGEKGGALGEKKK